MCRNSANQCTTHQRVEHPTTAMIPRKNGFCLTCYARSSAQRFRRTFLVRVHVALLTTSLPQVKVYSSARRNGRITRGLLPRPVRKAARNERGKGRGEGFFCSGLRMV